MVGTLIQPSFSKGEVTPELGGRVDLSSYKSALATARNVVVRPYGGLANRAGTKYLGFNINSALKSRLRKFRFNTTDTYVLEFGNHLMRVIRDDAYVLETFKPIVALSIAAGAVLRVTAHGWSQGDALQFDTHMIGMTQFSGRWVFVYQVVDADHVILGNPIGGTPINSLAYTPWVSGGNVARVFTLGTPWASADLFTLSFVQSADVLTITNATYDEWSLTRTGDATWTLSNPTFAPAAAPPTSVTVTPAVTAGASYSYGVTSIDATTGEESLVATGSTTTSATTRLNVIAWSAAANSALYSIYLYQNGVGGLIGTTPNTVFSDLNFAPDLSNTPPTARNPFAGAGNPPQTAMYFQQRLVRGGSTNNPDTTYASQIGNFYNESVGTPSTASDAVTFTLTSKEVNAIRHYLPVKQDLLVFTAGNEWRVTANGQGFSASTVDILPQSSWGSGYLEPILIGLTALFVRENGLMVRSARYTYVADAYTGEDVSLLSSHLFTPQSQIQDWAYGVTPDPIALCSLTSGNVACLTYQEEQQVNAWTRWDTQNGAFGSVECVRPDLAGDSLDDVPYFEVARTVQGLTVRTIERQASRRFTDVRDAYFVDGGLSYDNPVAITNIIPSNPVTVVAPGHNLTSTSTIDIFDVNWLQTFDATGNVIIPAQLNGDRFTVTVIDSQTIVLNGIDGTGFIPYVSGGDLRAVATSVTGLYHLEGETVSALLDGNAYLGLTVVNGTVTLPIGASRAHIGKQIIADVQTLELEAPQGSIAGKAKRIPFVTVRVQNSRGWLVGESTDDLIETKLRQYEDLGDPTALLTGDLIVTVGSHLGRTPGQVFIRQIYPLPLEILDIIPGMEVED